MEKYKIDDYVRVTKGQHLLTGRIIAQKDHQGRYLVKYDSQTNDVSVLKEGLYYEDELALCTPPKTV